MVPGKRAKNDRLLTEVELELMNAIWDLSEQGREVTVKDVQQALPAGRDLAYTSVATIMKILEQKKVLSSRKSERAHVYSPRLSRSEYEALTLKHVANNVFRGDPTSMVMRLLDDSELSEEALKQIRSLLDERLRS